MMLLGSAGTFSCSAAGAVGGAGTLIRLEVEGSSLARVLLVLTMIESSRSGLVSGSPWPDIGRRASGTGWVARSGMM